MNRLKLLAAFLLAALALGRAQDVPTLPKNAVSYRIITNDWLVVNVFGEPDLQTRSRVDAEGHVQCALLGPVSVYGLTLDAAQAKIEESYRKAGILVHPKVTLTIDTYAPRQVNVTGHVRNPARYDLPLETPTSLADVILKAGGFDDTAKGSSVTVTRILPDGGTKVWVFDVSSLLHGKDKKRAGPAAEFLLEPNDIVYVPQRII